MRGDGRTRRSLNEVFRSRLRGSKTMFNRPFRTPSHRPGLSATYLRTYSSFHCLWFSDIPLCLGCIYYTPGKAILSRLHCAQKNRRKSGPAFPPA